MKKRLLLKLGLVALLGAGLFVAWLWWTVPTTGVCRWTANRIRPGMTEEDVITTIGKLPSPFRMPPQLNSPAARGLVWMTDDNVTSSAHIKVCFNQEGLVLDK